MVFESGVSERGCFRRGAPRTSEKAAVKYLALMLFDFGIAWAVAQVAGPAAGGIAMCILLRWELGGVLR
jgi:hypothetical protein